MTLGWARTAKRPTGFTCIDRRGGVFAADEPGKEILNPVAIVIVGGLGSSTLLGLAVTPALFFRFCRKPALRALEIESNRRLPSEFQESTKTKTEIERTMKYTALKILTALALTVPAFAGDKGPHHDKKDAGPNGGRVITAVDPNLEFLVTKDRKVEITALTDDLKPAKMSGQVIAVLAGDRNNPTKLEFTEEDGRLVSSNALPDGDGFPVSVSIKSDPSGKATYEKFNFNLEKCPTCKYPEYACICGH